MTLLVARHAPVAVKGICYGQSDVPTLLDDDAACDAVLESLSALAVPVTRVWSSPWPRARGPATRIAARLGSPLTVDARLSELSFGAWEGRPYAELELDATFQAWMADWTRATPPGGEGLQPFLERVRAWRDEVAARDETTLAITHAGVIRALRAEAQGASYSDVVTSPVEPLRVESLQWLRCGSRDP